MRPYSEEKKLNIFMCVLTVMMFAGAACCIAVCLGICARLNETVMSEAAREHIQGEVRLLVCFIAAMVITAICMVTIRYRSRHRTEKMERAIVEANARNDAKSDFLSMMSHEIRTPLNSIMGLSSLVRKKAVEGSSITEYLDKMDSASSYLLSLINDILDMSFIESGKLVLEKQTFSLNEMISTVAYIYRPVIEEKGQSFTVTVDIKNDTVSCDRARLAQVLMNLVSNACKYTPPGGSIELSVREMICADNGAGSAADACSAAYSFAVRDNGIGISESDMKRVLAPFEQVRDKKRSGGLQGTGLGLAISRNILYMMGSDIHVSSVPGKGSVFSFELIMEKGGMSDLPENTDGMSSRGISGARILIADDNEMNAEMLADILEEEGAKCDVCGNGMDALNIFLKSGRLDDASGDMQERIDIILMDIQMPVMDGLTAAEEIRRSDHPDAADIPIIAVTALAFGDDIERSLAAGMNAHVTKPIHLEEICSVMAGLIEKRKLMRI